MFNIRYMHIHVYVYVFFYRPLICSLLLINLDKISCFEVAVTDQNS